jgi:hypothetical protein
MFQASASPRRAVCACRPGVSPERGSPWERVAPAAPRRGLHQIGGAVAKMTKRAKTSRCEREVPEMAFLLSIKKLYQRCFYIIGVLQI